jgi:asparagine synthase (glutamine-hydrolysing)
MCGIAGYFLRDGRAEHSVVKAMCDSIIHRGPDDEGFHVEGAAAIGMRRLSIIDLSTGHQPISNEDGTVWVVFNGEIYDYQALRADLISRGHRFHTHSDTETLVHLYEQEGIDGLHRLRGMFSFCIWDANTRKMLLVRDRFGKKPLYYAQLPQGLYFGSELKCLRAAGVPLDIDPDALRFYFQFQNIPDPYSIFRSVRKLEPGTWLEYSADGRMRTGRYWKLPTPVADTPAGFSEEQMCSLIRDKFDEAVRIRMIADVPLGAFLSGGIDSSSVVASMALQSKDRVKTFSIGFEEAQFNELKYAGMVARMYSTDHHEIVVKPDSVSLTERLVRHFDEPFADSSAIPTFIVSEFAAKHVKVALSGDGGDELFGGYESFQIVQNLAKWDRVPKLIRRAMSALAGSLPYSTYGKNYMYMVSRQTSLARYFESNYAPYLMRKELLNPEWMLPADEQFALSAFPNCLLPAGADPLSEALYFEATSKLSGDMLVKVDRMSMAVSLEVRSPMLDHELADIAAAVPHAYKIRNGRGKDILIRALGDRLPPELLNRPKMGFAIPLASWLRGPLREMLWDHLTGTRFLERGIASPQFVRHLLNEHQSGRRDNRSWLWALLVLEMWFRNFDSYKTESCGELEATQSYLN